MLTDLLSTNSDWTFTIIRIILGAVFFAHGAQRLLGWFGGPSLNQTIREMDEDPKLPIPLISVAVYAEFFGGLGLIVGLLSRVAAAGIGLAMLSAMVMEHGANQPLLSWFGDREAHRDECHLLAIALAIAVIAKGSGAASLDRLLYITIGA